jgi:UDP-N-acetylglucosamine 2-epimerase (non-hydrolysing)
VKIFLVFGTRPEAIKMAPLFKELKSRPSIQTKLIVTAQHRQMLDQVLKAFDIQADYDLNIMKQDQTLSDITTRVIQELSVIIKKEKPDMILVHGDTTTTFASALSAFYHQVKIGHVEAGLRTYNKHSPYPEEINRAFVGLVADFHFAPTEHSKQNLIKENKPLNSIFVTGNTGIDALKTTLKKGYYHPLFDWIGQDRLVLLTAHRRENLGEPMRNMFKGIKQAIDQFQDVKVLYPVHMNPKVIEVANEIFANHPRIKLIEPMEVLDFHNFIKKSFLILSDSGGIQEEASALGKPLLVLRDTTERPEGVTAGTLRLVGTKEEDIYKNTYELLSNQVIYDKMSNATNPYGDGNASKYIADILLASTKLTNTK